MDIQPQPIESAAAPSSISAEFEWIDFYQSMADGILSHQNKRKDLAYAAYSIVKEVTESTYLTDRYKDETQGPLLDICPFTVMGTFNRQLREEDRKEIAGKLADFLKVEKKVPDRFYGIPYLNNLSSWFFGFSSTPRRKEGDLNRLWNTFERAINFADYEANNEITRSEFTKAYDLSMNQFRVKWNLTVGLYWIRPWKFPPLDETCRKYIEQQLSVPIGYNGPDDCCSANDYLSVLDRLADGFNKKAYGSIDSFPALCLKAWEQ